MSSDRWSGQDGKGGEQAGHPGGQGEEFFEDQAVEAAEWLAGCRQARARGEGDHAVGAAGIADPVLAGLVEDLTARVDELVGYLPAGGNGRDLLEATVELHRQSDRLTAARAHFAAAYDHSMEWALKNRTAGARLSHRLRAPVGNDQVRLGRSLTVMPHTDTALSAGRSARSMCAGWPVWRTARAPRLRSPRTRSSWLISLPR